MSDPKTTEALVTYRVAVPPEWVDFNGHFNVGYYMVAFDRGTDGLADQIGLGDEYRERTGNAFFIVEANLRFRREVRGGAPIRIESLIVSADDKRFWLFHRMIEEAGGFVAATAQMLALHIDLSRRRAAPFAPELAAALAALAARHSGEVPPTEPPYGTATLRAPAP